MLDQSATVTLVCAIAGILVTIGMNLINHYTNRKQRRGSDIESSASWYSYRLRHRRYRRIENTLPGRNRRAPRQQQRDNRRHAHVSERRRTGRDRSHSQRQQRRDRGQDYGRGYSRRDRSVRVPDRAHV